MNPPILFVFGVEEEEEEYIQDAKWKNTSHAMTCSSLYLWMMMG